MCGKFTAMMTWGEYCALAGTGTDGGGGDGPKLDEAFVLDKFTPSMKAPVLHLGPVRQRRITWMRWGWLKPGAGDPLKEFGLLHARSDKVDNAPTWRESFQQRRGVIFARQFNIGEELPNGKIKQWQCRRPDDGPMALAVIYCSLDIQPIRLWTFAMITTEACAPLNSKDNRMPALLTDEDEIATWIGELGASDAELTALLRPYQGELVINEQPPSKPTRERNTTRAKPATRDPEPTLF